MATALRTEENALAFTENVILLKHFRQHLTVLAEPRLLELISLANTMPITNEDARTALKVGRNGAYYWLAGLVRLGVLEKRGQTYRASPYAKALVSTASLTFKSLVAGKIPQASAYKPSAGNDAALRTVIQTAAEGLEVLYSRGRIDETERMRRQKAIDELRAELDVPAA